MRGLGVWLLVALIAVSCAVAARLDNQEDDFGSLQAESADVASMQAESAAPAEAAAPQPETPKRKIAHALRHRVKAGLAHGLTAATSGDNGVSKPWQFFATNYTLTLSWIAFALMLVISCFLGGVGGWFIRKGCGERKNTDFNVDTGAHNLYS